MTRLTALVLALLSVPAFGWDGFIQHAGYRFEASSVYVLKDWGKSVDWSHVNGLVATAKVGEDGYYDVMLFDPDGSWEFCLTCGRPELPGKHMGNPAWHPSGEYLVFTAEHADVPDILDLTTRSTVPGRGLYHDLYLATADGTRFWRLLGLEHFPSFVNNAVIHPQFSPDGSLLVWSQRVRPDNDDRHDWGEWALKIADFKFVDGEPVVSNIRTLRPGEQHQFYETHGFSPDGKKLFFSGNLVVGQPPTGMDLYELSLDDGSIKRLTSSYEDWDEHGHLSPQRDAVAWISSTGFDIEYPDYDRWPEYLITELWVMNADGSGKVKLTGFNDPSAFEYTGGRTIAADSAWSPDGSRLIVAAMFEDESGELSERHLFIVELKRRLRFQDVFPIRWGK